MMENQDSTTTTREGGWILSTVIAIGIIYLVSRIFQPKQTRRRMRFVSDYEQYMKDTVPAGLLDHYVGGAGQHHTIPRNEEAFGRICLMTRILHPILHVDLRTQILDRVVDMPIGVAPTSLRNALWPDGDRCAAKAAAELQVINIVPMTSPISMEQVSKCGQSGINWLQIAVLEDDAHLPLLSRAKEAGFKAIVVGVDKRGLGKSVSAQEVVDTVRNAKCANLNYKPYSKLIEAIKKNISWRDIDAVMSETDLPVIIKGVLNPEDAITAVSHGVHGIIVSNHGGRAMDGVPATIEVLPAIKSAVGDQIEVYLDGGVRSGSDVLKALALGAKCVFLGRPVLYGLSYQGKEGVKQVFDILKEELTCAMIYTGCSSVSKIPTSIVMQPGDPRLHAVLTSDGQTTANSSRHEC